MLIQDKCLNFYDLLKQSVISDRDHGWPESMTYITFTTVSLLMK